MTDLDGLETRVEAVRERLHSTNGWVQKHEIRLVRIEEQLAGFSSSVSELTKAVRGLSSDVAHLTRNITVMEERTHNTRALWGKAWWVLATVIANGTIYLLIQVFEVIGAKGQGQ